MDLKTYQLLLETFKEELQELHQSLVDGLLSLEKITTPEELEEQLKTLFRFSHNLKGAAASASVNPVAVMAHRLENLFSDWRANHHFPTKAEVNACLAVCDNFFQVLNQCLNQETVDVEQHLKPLTEGISAPVELDRGLQSTTIKLPLARVERANAKADEFITFQLKLSNFFKHLANPLQELRQLPYEHPAFYALLTNLTQISHESEQFLSEFSRAVQSLQDELKAMRMMQISTLLSPLSRTIHTVASQLNKSVELIIEGGDIEMDKAILDAIKDPLTHMARNAVDHGIETDEARKSLNKPIPAKITIRISQIAGRIKLDFSDDGKGIDIEAIKQKALKSGLYTQDEVKQLTDEQLLNCLYMSGFSMQSKVTEISGRGVGLDIVKNNISKINGTISLTTQQGKGTTFTLMLPLTLATTRGVFFKLNEQTLMFPTRSLNAIFQVNLQTLKTVNNQLVFILNQKPIPIRMMSMLLRMDDQISFKSDKTYFGFLINEKEAPIMLLVESIVDEHVCVIKPLPFPYTRLDHYIGVTLTGQGELVLVLDPNKMIELALAQTGQSPPASQPEKPKRRILIVDDSLTTRTLCASALEAAGYETMTAINGLNAKELLKKEKFDAVITDIVMPIMDGFELTTWIKANSRTADIPVIIISLLDSKADKEKGLNAGANAFMVKSEFATHSLLELLDGLL